MHSQTAALSAAEVKQLRTDCPVCGSSKLENLVQRPGVIVHQNLLFDSPEKARAANRGDLTLKLCLQCGFAFNASFDLDKLSYGHDYENTQDCSSAFRQHVDSLLAKLIQDEGVQSCRILEVGCGQGRFIKALVEKEPSNTGYGFDPSYQGELEVGNLRFYQDYYGEQFADIEADVVISRHVIEHVPEPVELLKTIRKALKNSPKARLYFETPCLEWILKNQVVWDFFYEHCSYFSAASLATAMEVAGFQVHGVDHVFNGQYLWIKASCDLRPPEISFNPGDLPHLAGEYIKAEKNLIDSWRSRILEFKQEGKVALWGAGAKGATLANLIDPDCRLIDCIVDLNEKKQGNFLAGTAHPIVSYNDLEKRGVKTAILMNPNYYEENLFLLKQAGLDVHLYLVE